MTTYLSVVNTYAFGDSASGLWIDQWARDERLDLWWVAHQSDGGNWHDCIGRRCGLATPLFRLYWRAGYFERLITIPHRNGFNYLEPDAHHEYRQYIEFYHGGDRPGAMAPLHDSTAMQGLRGRAPRMDAIRDRFAFLATGHRDCGVIQPRSDTGGGKTMSRETLLMHLDRHLDRSGARTLVFFGTHVGREHTHRAMQWAREAHPQLRIEECTGAGIETVARLLYNARFVIGTESFAPLLALQFGIETTQVFRPTDCGEETRQKFERMFAGWDNYHCDTDGEACGND